MGKNDTYQKDFHFQRKNKTEKSFSPIEYAYYAMNDKI